MRAGRPRAPGRRGQEPEPTGRPATHPRPTRADAYAHADAQAMRHEPRSPARGAPCYATRFDRRDAATDTMTPAATINPAPMNWCAAGTRPNNATSSRYVNSTPA
ncbi:MAG: hypothetical protein RL721_1130 [Candidatus Eisenbacteria bacterium]